MWFWRNLWRNSTWRHQIRCLPFPHGLSGYQEKILPLRFNEGSRGLMTSQNPLKSRQQLVCGFQVDSHLPAACQSRFGATFGGIRPLGNPPKRSPHCRLQGFVWSERRQDHWICTHAMGTRAPSRQRRWSGNGMENCAQGTSKTCWSVYRQWRAVPTIKEQPVADRR